MMQFFLPVMELENFSQLDSNSKLLNRRTACDWPASTDSEISCPTPSAMFNYYRFGVSCGFTIVAPHVLHIAVRYYIRFLISCLLYISSPHLPLSRYSRHLCVIGRRPSLSCFGQFLFFVLDLFFFSRHTKIPRTT